MKYSQLGEHMIWFTSDTHFNHANIIKYCNRPFSNIKEMDGHIIDKINAYVKPDDTLYHLGDICFARRNKWVDKAKFYLEQINCKNIFILWGNHDQQKAYTDGRKKLSWYYPVLGEFLDTKIEGQQITLCHYAMAIWNKSHRGAWHLYGHSHAGAEEHMDKCFPNRRSMDVGVDNIYRLFGEYRPISFDEVKTIMDSKSRCRIDHH